MKHYTRVKRRLGKPLHFKPFLHALDSVIISDVAYALTGKCSASETAVSLHDTTKKERKKT